MKIFLCSGTGKNTGRMLLKTKIKKLLSYQCYDKIKMDFGNDKA
ncbi:hypothetical protein Cst_c09220 [Thermoclostridium stercorarium subsp. stercorarium DSM 8532]|uniref:Uncharacterized protein n=1 Tax=Thermoclostridium stercorarium (strain ATCC 35414 / DSM 8532 / NCIMB 11754) TaxID=1121335 RepID=L7VIN1_THES1|nr:hypothetical protein [Thermoclostridium stercorarium]AGC67920.1 hypothetical protein Cst_c09220 [Thermoclostridium stercorarium subsp. stercorarium DSM 8532]